MTFGKERKEQGNGDYMKIIKGVIPEEYNKLIKENELYLTIKTTGLRKKQNSIYGIAVAGRKGREFIYQICFAPLPRYEHNLIPEFLKFANQFDHWITYYGNRFDLPFLKEKLYVYDLKLPDIVHEDMYQSMRLLREELHLSSAAKKNVVEYLHLEEFPVSGREEIKLLQNLQKQPENEEYSQILIANLKRSLKFLFEVRKFLKPLEEENLQLLSDPLYKIQSVRFKGNYLTARGFTDDSSRKIYGIHANLSVLDDGSFQLDMPIEEAPYKNGLRTRFVKDFGSVDHNDLPFPDGLYPLTIGKTMILKNIRSYGEYLLIGLMKKIKKAP